MAGKKVQVPVLGGLRKVIQVPTAQNAGTTIQEFGSQVVSLAQLKAALGITSSKGATVAGGGVAGTSLIVGPGMSGGGVLTGAVNIGLLQSVPPVFWNDALLPDDFVGGAASGGTASPLTTKGDVYVFGTGNTRLPVGADGQILTARAAATNGVDWESITNSSLAYVNTTVPVGNTVTNTVTATAFASSYTIPAGYLPVGAVIRVVMKGVYSTAVAAPTISVALKLGSTVLLNTGTVSPLAVSATNDGWSYEALLVVQSIGSSGTIESQGTAVFQTAASGAAVQPLENTAPVTIDTTIAETLTAVVTWGTASASNTITLREMAIWVEGVAPSSGGGGDSSNITPDTHPATPTAWDDEFEFGTALDTAGARRTGANAWTFTPATGATTAVAGGSALINSGSGNGESFAFQSVPAGAWEFTAKAVTQQQTSGVIGVGITLRNGSTNHEIFFGGASSNVIIQRQTAGNATTGGTFNSTAYNSLPGGLSIFNWVYYKIAMNAGGTSLTYAVSASGIPGTFTTVFTETVSTWLASTTLQIGLICANANGPFGAWDWFRRTA